MTHNDCRHYRIIPLLILTTYTAILYTSHRILEDVSKPIPWMVPAAIALIIPALITIRDTIHLLGGPRRYFCSGARMIRSLINRDPKCSKPKEIIVHGPFSHTRHPVYSSTLLITIALTIVDPRLLLSIPAVTAWIVIASMIEERELTRLETYKKYRTRVPRISLIGVIRYGYSRISRRSR